MKKYKKMKKAILAGASSGIVAGMLIMGVSNTAFAEVADVPIPAYSETSNSVGMHMMHKWNSAGKVGLIASQLGLDKNQVMSELKEGKTMKQILQERGITPNDLGKAFQGRKSTHKRMWKNVRNFDY